MTTEKILTKANAEEIFRTNFEEADLSQFTAIEEDAECEHLIHHVDGYELPPFRSSRR